MTQFLSALVVERNVAASTQNQALSAILFLYRDFLEQDPPWLDDVVRSKRTARLPVVLTREEPRAVLQRMGGVPRLMAILLYGAGLRLLECARLRVKDVDFATQPCWRVRVHPAALRCENTRATVFHPLVVRRLDQGGD